MNVIKRIKSFFNKEFDYDSLNFGFEWHKIDVSTYTLITKQAEIRQSELLDVSSDLTQKGTKWLSYLIAFLSFVISLSISKNIEINLFLMGLSFVSLVFWVKLLLPKNIHLKGCPPSEIIPEDFDNEENIEHQKQWIQYNMVYQLEHKIQSLEISNKFRSNIYFYNLIYSIILLLVYLFHLLPLVVGEGLGFTGFFTGLGIF